VEADADADGASAGADDAAGSEDEADGVAAGAPQAANTLTNMHTANTSTISFFIFSFFLSTIFF
jgi:hypothetical protein